MALQYAFVTASYQFPVFRVLCREYWIIQRGLKEVWLWGSKEGSHFGYKAGAWFVLSLLPASQAQCLHLIWQKVPGPLTQFTL